MNVAELDRVLAARLMADAAEGIGSVAMELASLYDAWVRRGDCPEAVAWLRPLLEQLGWWAGRLECAANPALLERFPRLD